MAARQKNSVLEWCALFIIVAFPLTGIVWYVTSSGGAAASPSPAPVAVTAPSPAPAAPSPAAAQAVSATITLDDPTALPQSVTTGEIVPFSFTIKNTGTTAGAFVYKVYVEWNDGEKDVIDENSVTLEEGLSTSILESLKFESASATGQVFIEIPQASQSIHFALPRA